MMENKTESAINNILTLVGAACLAYPIITEITKDIAPKLDKLSSGEFEHTVKHLTDGKVEEDKNDDRHEEIEDLKRQLEEYKKRDETLSETHSE